MFFASLPIPGVMGGDQWPLGALDPRTTYLLVLLWEESTAFNKSSEGNTSLHGFQISSLAGVITTEYLLRPISDGFPSRILVQEEQEPRD